MAGRSRREYHNHSILSKIFTVHLHKAWKFRKLNCVIVFHQKINVCLSLSFPWQNVVAIQVLHLIQRRVQRMTNSILKCPTLKESCGFIKSNSVERSFFAIAMIPTKATSSRAPLKIPFLLFEISLSSRRVVILGYTILAISLFEFFHRISGCDHEQSAWIVFVFRCRKPT